MQIDLATILTILPHRPPFLFVERLRDVVPLQSGVGLKGVSAGEELLHGAGRDDLALPSFLHLELMAQTAAVICGVAAVAGVGAESRPSGAGYLVSADASFGRPVVPGDLLEAHMRIIKVWGRFVLTEGQVQVAGEVVASGRLTIAAA